jgi:dihydrofolate reductase
MATSIDSFIAKTDGDSEWVSEIDIPIFDKNIKEFGCIAMGGNTFRQFRGKYFPKKEALNIVITTKDLGTPEDGVVFAKSPSEALKIAEERGFERLLLIGGGIINGSFLKENLIDEIYLDVHPFVLGKGIKLFENFENRVNVEMISEEKLDNNQILLHYKIMK